jgi:hypothetical protein
MARGASSRTTNARALGTGTSLIEMENGVSSSESSTLIAGRLTGPDTRSCVVIAILRSNIVIRALGQYGAAAAFPVRSKPEKPSFMSCRSIKAPNTSG